MNTPLDSPTEDCKSEKDIKIEDLPAKPDETEADVLSTHEDTPMANEDGKITDPKEEEKIDRKVDEKQDQAEINNIEKIDQQDVNQDDSKTPEKECLSNATQEWVSQIENCNDQLLVTPQKPSYHTHSKVKEDGGYFESTEYYSYENHKLEIEDTNSQDENHKSDSKQLEDEKECPQCIDYYCELIVQQLISKIVLDSEMVKHEEQTNQYENWLAQTNSLIRDKTKELEDMQNRLNQAQSENDDLFQKIDSVSKEFDNTKANLANLVTQAAIEKEELSKALRDKKDKYDVLKCQNSELQSEYDELKENTKDLNMLNE